MSGRHRVTMSVSAPATPVKMFSATVRGRGIPLFLAVSGWLALGVTAAVGIPQLRSAAIFVFALAGPGTALVRLLPPGDFLERAVLAIALSMSLATVVAEAAAISHMWHPGVILAVLAFFCSAAAVVELARGVQPPC